MYLVFLVSTLLTRAFFRAIIQTNVRILERGMEKNSCGTREEKVKKRKRHNKHTLGEAGDMTVHKNKFGFVEIENPVYYKACKAESDVQRLFFALAGNGKEAVHKGKYLRRIYVLLSRKYYSYV